MDLGLRRDDPQVQVVDAQIHRDPPTDHSPPVVHGRSTETRPNLETFKVLLHVAHSSPKAKITKPETCKAYVRAYPARYLIYAEHGNFAESCQT